ncbi:hypothetical protein [Undibacterium sp.]|uniref:hypothetical protein n=1 Tax=Undibacterium sp. TaxID=1914977 RepID=UPI002C795D4A|nr:hypothetical protein [Undibacterium sp.]HTD05975.1 hypothetical protein [Undibacterium sp.]
MSIKKIQLLILIGAALIATTSWSQERKASTRSVCNSRCNAFPLDGANIKFAEPLNKIRAAIAKETDPEKLKALRQQEKEEYERAKEKLPEICEDICKGNPE